MHVSKFLEQDGVNHSSVVFGVKQAVDRVPFMWVL